MKRKYLLNLFFLLLNLFCFSQKHYEYVGAVVLNDTITISYKLQLTEDNGLVKGYSLTDIGGEHETKSSVYGEYNKEKKELDFRETAIVYTKSPVSQNDFCFIHTRFKNFTFEKTKSLKSSFIGLFSDNEKCVDGELFLNAMDKVQARMDKVVNKINRSKKISDSIKNKIGSLKLLDSLKMNILRKDQVLSVFSSARSVNLIIYDGGKEDGDRITVFSNGKPILKNYEAKSITKVVSVDLEAGKTTLVIKANNEGNIAPNTVVVKIDDGKI